MALKPMTKVILEATACASPTASKQKKVKKQIFLINDIIIMGLLVSLGDFLN